MSEDKLFTKSRQQRRGYHWLHALQLFASVTSVMRFERARVDCGSDASMIRRVKRSRKCQDLGKGERWVGEGGAGKAAVAAQHPVPRFPALRESP